MRPGKLDDLKYVIENILNTVHLILLTETWLNTEEAISIQLDSYAHYYNCRIGCKGRGV